MTTRLKPLIAGELFAPNLFQFLRHCVKISKTLKYVSMRRGKSSVRSVLTLAKLSWEISIHFVTTERGPCLQTLEVVSELSTR